MSEQRIDGIVPSSASPRRAVPVRPLFSWAQDEALLKRLAQAESEIVKARLNLRRAPHGQKRKAEARLKKAVLNCLKIEAEIKKRERDVQTKN